MKPTADQLSAAREWLNEQHRRALTGSFPMKWNANESLAALLCAREAAVDRAAYRRGWEAALAKVETFGAPPALPGTARLVAGMLAAIRALEPPSGEGE